VSNTNKIVVLLLLVALAGGAYWYLNHGTTDAPPVAPAPMDSPAAAPTTTPDLPAPVSAEPPPPPPPANAGRTELADPAANADAAQGVRGRVLLPNGAPAANVPVVLVENMVNNLVDLVVLSRLGRTPPPLASAQTGPDGMFALGIRRLGKPVDLRVLPVDHAEYHQQSIRVRDGDWYDVPDIRLEPGSVVQGRVVDATTKGGVPNATVFLASASEGTTLVAAPGRERGIPMTTDANGAFRYGNAPRNGVVNLLAEAPGYASGQVRNLVTKPDGVTEATIEVELGQPIGGIVVDGNGRPIGGAMVNATGHSLKTPQTASVTTANDGTFEFPTLRTGPYGLAVTASQFAEVQVPLVLTGETDVKVVMPVRGMVKLRVLGANQAVVKVYRLSLKRVFPQNPDAIGNVPEFADVSINPGSYPSEYGGEWALVRGLPAGDFRFQITDAQHAKTLSPQFTVVPDTPPIEVQAQLTLGGTITGTVIDDAGRPVSNAIVATDMNGGMAADNPLFEILRGMMPEKHSKSSVRTDAQGRFRISKLAFADYMVRASHPDYCEGNAINLKVETEGQEVPAGTIQLSRGAVVEGIATVGGVPVGQIKITMSVPMTAETLPSAPAGAAPPQLPGQVKMLFNATSHSDGEGRFRMTKRVPPGTYKATAMRPTVGNNLFEGMLDMRNTEQQIVVAPGQDRVFVEFHLPAK
jgi:uncharacterized GH25 family protein